MINIAESIDFCQNVDKKDSFHLYFKLFSVQLFWYLFISFLAYKPYVCLYKDGNILTEFINLIFICELKTEHVHSAPPIKKPLTEEMIEYSFTCELSLSMVSVMNCIRTIWNMSKTIANKKQEI